MGNICASVPNRELLSILQSERTGELLKMKPEAKHQFMAMIQSHKIDGKELERLQPDKMHPATGFLYKQGCLFYEGGLAIGKKTMEGQGHLTIIPRNIEYFGKFKQDQLDGQGILSINRRSVKLEGKWRQNVPLQLKYKSLNSQYTVEFLKVQHGHLETIEVRISYPNQNVYQGQVCYNPNKKKYIVTGQGKLEMKGKGQFIGRFQDGKIHDQNGKFIAKDGGKYQGSFVNGKMEGKGKYKYPNGAVLDLENWSNNKPDGLGTYTDAHTKKTVEVYFQKGQRIQNPLASKIKGGVSKISTL